MLLNEAMDASALVGRFLDFARPLHLAPEEFELTGFLTDIVASFRRKFPKICIEDHSLKSSPIKISGDSLLLKQALGNIIDNACRAAGNARGNVTIGAKRQGQLAEIIISDNGHGIPEDIKDKIFTPFVSDSPSGSGLGLPLSRKIIIMHGGRVTFESEPDSGTIFTISLPIMQIPVQEKSKIEMAGRRP